MADDAVIRLAHRGQSERISSSAGGDEEDGAVGLEKILKKPGSAGGPTVVAVSRRMAAVGFGQRLHGLGTDAGIGIACELADVEDGRGVGHGNVSPIGKRLSFCFRR